MSQKNFSPWNQFKIFQKFYKIVALTLAGKYWALTVESASDGQLLLHSDNFCKVSSAKHFHSGFLLCSASVIFSPSLKVHILGIRTFAESRLHRVKQKIRRRRCTMHVAPGEEWLSLVGRLVFGVGAAPGLCDSSPSLSHNPVSRSILLHVKAALSAGDPKYPERVPIMLGKSKSMSWIGSLSDE